MTECDDDELMVLAGRGNRDAFTELVRWHGPRAGSIAGRITDNHGDAEEIVQEALLRAWTKAPDWEPRDGRGDRARFSTWLHRVVVNLALDRVRRPRTAALDAVPEVADPEPDAFERTVAHQRSTRVAAAVSSLPDRQRAVLVLCHYEEMSNTEAAAVLGLSVGAVESLAGARPTHVAQGPRGVRGGGEGMRLRRFLRLLDARGSDLSRWPEAERSAAKASLETSADARAARAEAQALGRLLDTWSGPDVALDPAALTGRVTRATQPRPRTKAMDAGSRPLRWLLPNAAGLAAAALAGLLVGWSGLGETLFFGGPVSLAEQLDQVLFEEALW